ncbi:hypothetical protein L1887_57545 [Cichorium endivia]|nr:hypothetical protein L1887_57545 [Cichorium endivia]
MDVLVRASTTFSRPGGHKPKIAAAKDQHLLCLGHLTISKTRGKTRRVLRSAKHGTSPGCPAILNSPDEEILLRYRDPRSVSGNRASISNPSKCPRSLVRSPFAPPPRLAALVRRLNSKNSTSPTRKRYAAAPPHFEHRSWRLDRGTEPLLFQQGRGEAQPAPHCLRCGQEYCSRACALAWLLQSRSIAHAGLESKTSKGASTDAVDQFTG